jgi:uncharacterized membrane protein YesL
MIGAGKSLWRGLQVFERYGHVFVMANLFAALLSLPIVTAPAAWGGLCRLARTAHNGPSAHISDFWSGFRESFGRGLIIGLISVGLGFMLLVNYTTYVLQSGPLFMVLRVVWLTAWVMWVCTVLYLFPLWERMERPSLRLGLQNALTMTLKNPFFSLTLIGGLGLIAALSTLLIVPWALITLSLFANSATAAVDDQLRAAHPPKSTERESNAANSSLHL